MEGIAMADRSQEKEIKNFKDDREMGTDYYAGSPGVGLSSEGEENIPYKLEPNTTEIEEYLTRLRQEGL